MDLGLDCKENGFSIDLKISCLTVRETAERLREMVDFLGAVEEYFRNNKEEGGNLSCSRMNISLDLR